MSKKRMVNLGSFLAAGCVLYISYTNLLLFPVLLLATINIAVFLVLQLLACKIWGGRGIWAMLILETVLFVSLSWWLVAEFERGTNLGTIDGPDGIGLAILWGILTLSGIFTIIGNSWSAYLVNQRNISLVS